MPFISEAQRAKHAFLEDSIGNTQDILRHNTAVQQQLGSLMTQRLAEVGDNVFIANVHRGRIQVPEGVDESEAIPVVAMKVPFVRGPWAKLAMPARMLLPTPGQLYNTKAQLVALNEKEPDTVLSNMLATFKAAAGNKMRKFAAPEPGSVAATEAGMIDVTLPNATLPSPTASYALCGRPWLILPYWRQRRPVSPSVMAHEYTHILQRESGLRLTDSEPTRPNSAAVREASACLTGARVAEGLSKSGYPLSGVTDRIQNKISQVIMDYTQGDLSKGLPRAVIDEMRRLSGSAANF